MPFDRASSTETNSYLYKNNNFRVVLPHSSCPPRRRVVIPSSIRNSAPSQDENDHCELNKTNQSMPAVSEKKNDQCQLNEKKQSKSAAAAQKYKEYLEDMELKIRYMKNDIEFKQSQIMNKKLSSSETANPGLQSNNSSGDRNQNLTRGSSLSDKTRAKIFITCSHNCIAQFPHKQMVPKFSFPQGSQTTLLTQSNSLPANAISFISVENDLKPSKADFEPKSCTSKFSVSSVKSSSSHSFIDKVELVQAKSNSVSAVVGKSHQFTNLPTTSVFQRLGEPKPSTSPAPIYVSPSKTQAIWSHSSQNPEQLSAIPRTNLAQSLAQCKTQNASSRMVGTNTMPVAVASKYKLVKSRYNSLTGSTCQNVLDDSSLTQPILHPHQKLPLRKTVIQTPKSKVPRKYISKYKVSRLSPNSASKVSGKFKHVAPENASNRFSFNSSPTNKFPKREVLVASKLVSKYKLKRLLPSAESNLPPNSFSKPQVSTSLPESAHVKDKASSLTEFNPNKYTNPFNGTSAKTLKLKTPNTHRKSPHHFKTLSYTYRQDKRTPTKPRKSAMSHPFVLDKRNRLAHEPKKMINNKHKLDRRPSRSSSEHLRNWSGSVLALKRNKHSWVSPTASGSLSSSGTSRELALNTRYKWRQSSRSHPSDSRFKWSRQRFLSGSNMWRQNDQRNYWLTKPNLVMIRGVVYSSKRQTSPYKSKSCSSLTVGSQKSNMKLITVRGEHFHSDFQGKKLSRTGLDHQNKSQGPALRRRSKSQGKGVDGSSILAANRVVHRSLAVAAAKFKRDNTKWKREKRNCLFFTRFGKCHRGEKCKYVHDPEKIAVCTRFLRGKCDAKRCQFSHNASEHKMPVCLHYLQGLCSRDECPYLHVRVNPDAPVCKDFQHGYCSLGKKCKKLHSLVCPSFAVTGHCLRGEACSLLHRRIRKEQRRQHDSLTAKVQNNKGNEQSLKVSGRSSEEPRSCEGILAELFTSNSCDDLQSKLQGQSTSESQDQAHAQFSAASEQRQYNEAGVHPSQSSVSTQSAGPKKGSAPLASQPSFISLLSDSPAVGNLNKPLSGSSAKRECESGLIIKPLFVANKLHELEHSKVDGLIDTSKGIHQALRQGLAKSMTVPTPAFLSSKMYKGNVK